MPGFKLNMSDEFKANYKEKPEDVRAELNDVMRFLEQSGPKHPSLNSHPVTDRKVENGESIRVWESYVTYSHRVLWNYQPGFSIFLRSTDGHEILPPKGS